jgi:hypothetical protein
MLTISQIKKTIHIKGLFQIRNVGMQHALLYICNPGGYRLCVQTALKEGAG